MEERDTEMEYAEIDDVVQFVENMNAVTQVVACPPDSYLIHDDLVRISGQLKTIIELLRSKEQ